ILVFVFFFSSRRRHTRCLSDWSSDVCSSDLQGPLIRSVGRVPWPPPARLVARVELTVVFVAPVSALAVYPGRHRHRPWPPSTAAAPCQSAGRRSGSPDSSSLRRNHGSGALWFSSQVAHPRDREASKAD